MRIIDWIKMHWSRSTRRCIFCYAKDGHVALAIGYTRAIYVCIPCVLERSMKGEYFG